MSRHNIAQINGLSRTEFVRVIGPVFEKSPWIAAAAAQRRPFSSPGQLLQTLCDVVRRASLDVKLALIRAHPELADRLARAGGLTGESRREQAGAGLARLTPEEIELFRRRNEAYRNKFGFPFVICARLNDKDAILAGLARRLKNSRQKEIRAALEEIRKIAELRLRDLLAGDAGKLTSHVLDTAAGRPAAGMKIELWSLGGSRRRRLKTIRTNADGRPGAPLLAEGEMRAGDYELVFFVGDYFAAKKPRFLDRVPVRFTIAEADQSYHIPLLCSLWSYTTYRGS